MLVSCKHCLVAQIDVYQILIHCGCMEAIPSILYIKVPIAGVTTYLSHWAGGIPIIVTKHAALLYIKSLYC